MMRSTAPPSRKAGHVRPLSGHAALITDLRTLLWSSGAAPPPGGTSRFPPSLRRSTASKGRFLSPLVVPWLAQLNHPYTSPTRGRASSPRASGTVPQSRSKGRAPSAPGAGSPCCPCACGAGAAPRPPPAEAIRAGSALGAGGAGWCWGRGGWGEMYVIVATLYKFRSWLQTGVKIKCRTDHKSLRSWVKEDFDRMGGPVGRLSRWHQFLARFPLEVVYINGEDNGAADVLSRLAYPAWLANPDTNLHGSDADQAGWDASEQETAQWVDAALARSALKVDPEPHHTPLPPRTRNTPDGERMKHLDLSTDQVRVNWVEVNCTLPSTGQSLAGAVHQWRAALRPVSHSDGNSEFCKDRELTEQAKRARRQQAFVNALLTGPRRATVRQLAHRVSGDVVSVRHDSCNYARNAPDAHGLHWRSKRPRLGHIRTHSAGTRARPP